jgi:hypothetical protein
MALGLLLFAGPGCGGANNAADQDKLAAGKTLEIIGVISVRGATPAGFVLLLADDHAEYTLQPSDLTRELSRLDNVRVIIEGKLQAPSGKGPILLQVARYRILALENGDEPLVGWVMVKNDGCFLQELEGPEWHLTGDLAALLEGFNGAKIWVIGERIRRGGAERDMEVEGYGILSER